MKLSVHCVLCEEVRLLMQIHNKRFIFIRIMVKVNVVADQNLIINLELSVPSV